MDNIDIARFWSKVDVKAISQCWPWKASTSQNGYGEFKVDGAAAASHRLALKIAFNADVDGHVVRHLCDNPACCNPYHLLLGSHSDNVQDRVNRDRSAKGERNGRAKLTSSDVAIIRSAPEKAAEMAKRFNVSIHTIRGIRQGTIWRSE